MKQITKNQRGFGLVGTIFIVVACALIGVYMVSLGVSQSISIGRSIESTRAYYAALAGLEWAINQANGTKAQHDAICGTTPQSAGGIATTFTLTEGTLNGFTVTITCDDIRPEFSDVAETVPSVGGAGFTEGVTPYELDRVTIRAQHGTFGTLDYVSREIQGTIKGRAI